MRNWILPEAIDDVLPAEAARLEALRRCLLDHFAAAGYRLVQPPLVEHLESLLTGSGHDLDLSTFKVVDPMSGRLLGVRADITPQVARIDAHLLNETDVTRLCYAGSVLRTHPRALGGMREVLQVGAELFGEPALAGDREVIDLLVSSLRVAGLPALHLDLGHVGLFRALAGGAGLAGSGEDSGLFDALRQAPPGGRAPAPPGSYARPTGGERTRGRAPSPAPRSADPAAGTPAPAPRAPPRTTAARSPASGWTAP